MCQTASVDSLVMSRLGPHSRPERLANIDRRTREGRLLDEVRSELTDHVGGQPNAAQRMLIERAAQLSLQLAMMERSQRDGGGPLSDRNGRAYLAWSNALQRCVRELGLQPVKQEKARSLSGLLAARRAEASA